MVVVVVAVVRPGSGVDRPEPDRPAAAEAAAAAVAAGPGEGVSGTEESELLLERLEPPPVSSFCSEAMRPSARNALPAFCATQRQTGGGGSARSHALHPPRHTHSHQSPSVHNKVVSLSSAHRIWNNNNNNNNNNTICTAPDPKSQNRFTARVGKGKYFSKYLKTIQLDLKFHSRRSN